MRIFDKKMTKNTRILNKKRPKKRIMTCYSNVFFPA